MSEKITLLDLAHARLHGYGDLADEIFNLQRALTIVTKERNALMVVVEAAKHHEQIWRQKSDQGDRIICGCGICEAIRSMKTEDI